MEIVSPYFSHGEYLERAYAHQEETGGQYIPFYHILEKLFKDLIQPDKAATHVSSFIFSNDDFLSVYSGVVTSIIAAAQQLSEARDLEKLATLVLALSQLPDIRNESSETLDLNFNLNTSEISPGQVIKVDDGKIWSELPGFATDLGDCMRGIFPSFLTLYRDLILLPQVLQPTSMTAHPNISPNNNGQIKTHLLLTSSMVVTTLHVTLIICINMPLVFLQIRWNGMLEL
jgi:hypothetical protein